MESRGKLSDEAESTIFDGFSLPRPERCSGHWQVEQEVSDGGGDDRLVPRVTKPATVLPTVKDEPFGWPPSGGHP